MVRTIVREPRPGTAAKKPDLLRPGATITVAGLAAEAGAGLAVVRWTNPEGGKGGKRLDPSSMEVLALRELPLGEKGEGAPRELVVEAARAAIAAALPAPGPDAPVYLYTKDRDSGSGGGQLDEAAQERLERSHEALLQAVQGIPVSGSSRVAANVLSSSMGVNARTARTRTALDTARTVFPQAADRLGAVEKDAPLANALLVVAHVVGAAIVKGEGGAEEPEAGMPRSPATGGVETPTGGAAAAAAPATERPKHGTRRREGEAGPRAAKRSAPVPAQEVSPPLAVAPTAAPIAQPGSPGMPAINPAMLSVIMMHQQQLLLQQQAQAQQVQQAQQQAAWPGLGGPAAAVPSVPAAAVGPGVGPQLQQWHAILPIIDMSELAQRQQQQLAAAAAAPAPAVAPGVSTPLQPALPGGPPAFGAAAYLQSLQSPQFQQTYHRELAALNQQGQGQGQGLGQGQPAGIGSGPAGGPAPTGGGSAADAAAAAAAAGPSSGAGQPAPPDYGSAPTSPSGDTHGRTAAGEQFDQQFDQQFDYAAPLVEQALQVAQQAWQAQGATHQVHQAQQHFAAGGSGGSAAAGGAAAGIVPHMAAAASEATPPEAAPAQAEAPLGGLQGAGQKE